MFIACPGLLSAQSTGGTSTVESRTIEVEPGALTLEIGSKQKLIATVRDGSGAVVDDATVVFYSRARRSVSVTRNGVVEAYRSGEFTVVALVPADPEDKGRRPESIARIEVPVMVPPPPVAAVRFFQVPSKFYVNTRPRLEVEVIDTSGSTRSDVTRSYSSGDVSVAEIDSHGFLSLLQPGKVELSVRVEDAVDTIAVDIEPNPIMSLTLRASALQARTGDVVVFTAVAKDARGLPVRSVPVQFSVAGETDPTIIASGAPAMVTNDGRFVAERSGTYTVVATSGSHVVSQTVQILSLIHI